VCVLVFILTILACFEVQNFWSVSSSVLQGSYIYMLIATSWHDFSQFIRLLYTWFCRLNKICPSFRETCQWLKFPLNGLRAQSRVSPVVGLVPLASRPTCLGMAFPPFLLEQLYRCDSVVISSFVRTGYTTRKWGWLLGRIGYSITHHHPLYP